MKKRSKRSEYRSTLWRFYAYLKPYSGKLALIFLLIALVAITEIAKPRIIGFIIDASINESSWQAVLPYLLIFLTLVLVRSLFLLGRNYLLQKTGMRVTCDVRIGIFTHLQKLSLKFYDQRQTGKIVSRITDDANSVHNLVTGASVNMLGDLLTLVGVLVVLLHSNWQLALLTYALLPLFLFNFLWHRRRLRIESRIHRRNWDRVLGFLYERIASTRLVKSFATEDSETAHFRVGIESDYKNYNKVIWRNTLLGTGAETIAGLGFFSVLALGSYFVVNKISGFSIGDLTAFTLYLGMFCMPLSRA